MENNTPRKHCLQLFPYFMHSVAGSTIVLMHTLFMSIPFSSSFQKFVSFHDNSCLSSTVTAIVSIFSSAAQKPHQTVIFGLLTSLMRILGFLNLAIFGLLVELLSWVWASSLKMILVEILGSVNSSLLWYLIDYCMMLPMVSVLKFLHHHHHHHHGV